jgi:hypothetical protein
MKPAYISILICIIAAIITITNLLLTPLGNGRDELFLMESIDFYYNEQRLPVLPDDWDKASMVIHHPPLYFALSASLISLVLPEANSQSYTRNQFANFDYYSSIRYNLVVLLAEDNWSFPGEGKTRTWHTLRFTSILFNMVTVYALWRAAHIFFGKNRLGVPLTLSFLILSPAFSQTAITLNGDHLLLMFSSLVIWLLVRTLRIGPNWWTSGAIGVFLGLGLLSKSFMLTLVPAVPFVFLWCLRTRWRDGLKHLVLIGVLIISIAGWWYIRNYILYGDFTAVNQVEAHLGTYRSDGLGTTTILNNLFRIGGMLWFEQQNLVVPAIEWTIVGGYIAIGLVISAFAASLRHHWDKNIVPGGGEMALVIFTVAFATNIYGMNRNLHGEHPIVMRAVWPALCLLSTATILSWTPSKWQFKVTTIVVVLLGIVAIAYQFLFFFSIFPPIVTKQSNSIEIDNRLNIDFENGIRLIGYEINKDMLKPGERTQVKLCWEALDNLNTSENYAFTIQLVLPSIPKAASIEAYHLSGRYPSSVWKPGQAFCEEIPLEVRPEAVTPRAYELLIGMFIFDGLAVNYYRDDGTLSNYLVVQQVGVINTIENVPPIKAQVGDWGGLSSYEVHREDSQLQITLDWYVLNSVDSNQYLRQLWRVASLFSSMNTTDLGYFVKNVFH